MEDYPAKALCEVWLLRFGGSIPAMTTVHPATVQRRSNSQGSPMIPRRLYDHVKAHNWFAVAIDLLIVVIGG
jgi:hypothetical protein